jgi:AcrR family transcriptional regulator
MATTRGPRGGYATGQVRRAQILDAALNRFGQDGYRRTSLARVAEDAGITDAGLLHHFRDKQQLLHAVVEYWFQRQDEHWTRVSASATAREVFRSYLQVIEANLREPGMVELEVVLAAEAISPDHPAHALFSGWQENGVQRLAANLRAGSESGELEPDADHVALARECFAIDAGIRLQWLASGRAFDLINIVRVHLDRLLRDISTDRQGLLAAP